MTQNALFSEMSALSKLGMADPTTSLPVEMLTRIFRLLPPRSLKTAVLVCRRWREVGEGSGLWHWVTLALTTRNMDFFSELLESPRFLTRRTVAIKLDSLQKKDKPKISESLLQAILDHPSLTQLNVEDPLNTCVLKAGQLVRVMGRMEEVNIPDSVLSDEQFIAIFEAISQKSNLRKVNLGHSRVFIKLASVPRPRTIRQGLFAKAVSTLEELNISGIRLSFLQVEEIFTAITEHSNLKKLTLGLWSLNNNSPENHLNCLSDRLLSTAVARLEHFEVYRMMLVKEKYEAILTAITSEDSKLKTIKFGCKNMTKVDSELLAKAINKLEDVALRRLTLKQFQTILEHCSNDTRLKKIIVDFVEGRLRKKSDLYIRAEKCIGHLVVEDWEEE